MEKIILKRLLNEIDNKNILCNKQIGFIRGCEIELNLIRLRQRVNDLKHVKNFSIINMFYLLILKMLMIKLYMKNYLLN